VELYPVAVIVIIQEKLYVPTAKPNGGINILYESGTKKELMMVSSLVV
jgi:hypothetical protein